jgi:hypothetical protein
MHLCVVALCCVGDSPRAIAWHLQLGTPRRAGTCHAQSHFPPDGKTKPIYHQMASAFIRHIRHMENIDIVPYRSDWLLYNIFDVV